MWMDTDERMDGWMGRVAYHPHYHSLITMKEVKLLLFFFSWYLSLSPLPIRNDKVRGSREKLTTNLA